MGMHQPHMGYGMMYGQPYGQMCAPRAGPAAGPTLPPSLQQRQRGHPYRLVYEPERLHASFPRVHACSVPCASRRTAFCVGSRNDREAVIALLSLRMVPPR